MRDQDSSEQTWKFARDLVVQNKTSWCWCLWKTKEFTAAQVCGELDNVSSN